MGDLISSNAPRPITPELIFEQTTEMYGFSKEELIGGSRRRPLVTARQVAMYIFRELTDLSYPDLRSIQNQDQHKANLCVFWGA